MSNHPNTFWSIPSKDDMIDRCSCLPMSHMLQSIIAALQMAEVGSSYKKFRARDQLERTTQLIANPLLFPTFHINRRFSHFPTHRHGQDYSARRDGLGRDSCEDCCKKYFLFKWLQYFFSQADVPFRSAWLDDDDVCRLSVSQIRYIIFMTFGDQMAGSQQSSPR